MAYSTVFVAEPATRMEAQGARAANDLAWPDCGITGYWLGDGD
jgi:hypothetical protein